MDIKLKTGNRRREDLFRFLAENYAFFTIINLVILTGIYLVITVYADHVAPTPNAAGMLEVLGDVADQELGRLPVTSWLGKDYGFLVLDGEGNVICEQGDAQGKAFSKEAVSCIPVYDADSRILVAELPKGAEGGSYLLTRAEYLEDGSVYEVRPANGQVSEKTQDTDAATSQMDDLTNSMETDVPFRKEWIDSEDEEITEDYLGYELAIDFKLQVAEVTATETGDGTSYTVGTWQDASQYMKKNLSEDDYNTIFGSDFEFTKPLSGRINDPVWAKGGTFQDLPRTITKTGGGNVRLIYRAVESEIRYGTSGKITVTVKDSQDNYTYTYEFSSEGLFSPAYDEGTNNNAGTSTHVNRLGSTGLTVTKQWEGDRNNAYSTRPETDKSDADWETIFVIQRSTDPNDKDSWTNVTDGGENGKALIVYVTGINQDDSASATVTGLPAQDADGKDYHYRARELQPAEDRYIDGKAFAYGDYTPENIFM